MYFYINIRKDSKYSQSVSVELITQVLDRCSELVAEDERHYKNAREYSWARVSIINCDDKGNYPAGFAQNTSVANLVELAFSNKGHIECEQYFSVLANKIAIGLNWEAGNSDTGDVIL